MRACRRSRLCGMPAKSRRGSSAVDLPAALRPSLPQAGGADWRQRLSTGPILLSQYHAALSLRISPGFCIIFLPTRASRSASRSILPVWLIDATGYPLHNVDRVPGLFAEQSANMTTMLAAVAVGVTIYAERTPRHGGPRIPYMKWGSSLPPRRLLRAR